MEGESQSSRILHWLRIVAIGRRPKRTLVRLVVLIVLSFVTFRFALLPVRVTGMSMEPTYHDGTVNLINRLAYVRSEPQRGDVVGVRMSRDTNASIKVMLLKRVVGLPGETVSFAGGHVRINGVVQSEPYLKLVTNWHGEERVLGSDEYYVVGDNRSMTPEEHTHGAVQRWRIVGKVLLKGNG